VRTKCDFFPPSPALFFTVKKVSEMTNSTFFMLEIVRLENVFINAKAVFIVLVIVVVYLSLF